MYKKIRLISMHCIVWTIIVELYLQLVNNKNTILLQDSIFIIFFFIGIFKILNILLSVFRYSYNVSNTINTKDNFKVDISTLIFNIDLIIFIILIIIKHKHIFNFIQSFDILTNTFHMYLSWIFLKYTDLDDERKDPTLTELNIDLMQGLAYGTCMAYNYYYGYLKITLPATGSLNKGIIEKIENIEDMHNISISIHKLIILIPSSSYISPEIKNASYQWIESAMNLESEVRNRAGVKRRMYHNSVYKIYPDGPNSNCKPLYLVMEGASPLLTFYDVLKHNHCETNTYQKYKKDIIKKFYEKLKQLIDDDPECREICELIYYDDYDSNGIKVNVAKVILSRLFHI